VPAKTLVNKPKTPHNYALNLGGSMKLWFIKRSKNKSFSWIKRCARRAKCLREI